MDSILNFFEFFTLEGLIKIIFQSNSFSEITDLMSINLFSPSGQFGGILNVIRAMYNTVFPVAVMLLFIYFMLAMIEKCSNDTFSWEQMWKLFAALLASKIIIEHGFEILEYLFSVGLSIVNSFSGLRSPGSEFALGEEEIQEILETLNSNMAWVFTFLRNILIWIALLIPALVAFIMKSCIFVICFSRIAEIYVRVVLTPVALSDFFHGGMQSAGWRYLKSFLAISLQGAMIIVIAMVYEQLMAVMLGNYAQDHEFWKFFSISMIMQASSIMLMFKSLNLAKEVLGVA